MRRLVFLALASAVGLSVVALTRGAGSVAPAEVAPARARAAAAAPSEPPRALAPGAPLRNVFEYGESPDARPAPPPAPTRAAGSQAAPAATAPDPVRFIGVVARGGGPKAALVIGGEVVLLSPGESAMGYTLLTVDRDEGATLRTPTDGEMRATVSP